MKILWAVHGGQPEAHTLSHPHVKPADYVALTWGCGGIRRGDLLKRLYKVLYSFSSRVLRSYGTEETTTCRRLCKAGVSVNHIAQSVKGVLFSFNGGS